MPNRTFVPNLIALIKIKRAQELIVSLNSSLCTYLMRQNLRNRISKTLDYKYPCHVWKWSEKNCRQESANGDFQCASHDRLISIMKIPIPGKTVFILRQDPFIETTTMTIKNQSFALLIHCEGKPTVTSGFPSQRAGEAKSMGMSRRHHESGLLGVLVGVVGSADGSWCCGVSHLDHVAIWIIMLVIKTWK